MGVTGHNHYEDLKHVLKTFPLSVGSKVESAPVDSVVATAEIGEGVNGVVTISAWKYGAFANEYDVAVALGDGASLPLNVSFAEGTLTIELGTDASSLADGTKNTALLIAAAITESDVPFVAVHSGTGESTVGVTSVNVAFTGGVDGEIGFEGKTVFTATNIYFCVESNTTDGSTWKTIAFA